MIIVYSFLFPLATASLSVALMLPTAQLVAGLLLPDVVNEKCASNYHGLLRPDAPECRKEGPTKCCNCIYEEQARRQARDYEQAFLQWQAAEALAIREKKRPPAPLPKFPDINLDDLDIYQGDQFERVMPTRTGKESFTFRCWVNLADDSLRALLGTRFMKDKSALDSLSRVSRKFKIRCDFFEGLEYYTEWSRRAWDSTPSDGDPDRKLTGARCVRLGRTDWLQYQANLAREGLPRAIRPKKFPELLDFAKDRDRHHDTEFEQPQQSGRKRKRSSVIVQPGAKTACIEFPRLEVADFQAAANDGAPQMPLQEISAVIPQADTAEAAAANLALLIYTMPATTDSFFPSAEAETQIMMEDPLRWDPLNVHGAMMGMEDHRSQSWDLSQALRVTADHPVTRETFPVQTRSTTSSTQPVAIAEASWSRDTTVEGHAREQLPSIDELQLQACLTTPLTHSQIALHAELLSIMHSDV